MTKFVGKINKNELSGGFWELVTADGSSYQLQSSDSALQVDGLSVEIDGEVDRGAMGIGMTGPVLKVASWRAR